MKSAFSSRINKWSMNKIAVLLVSISMINISVIADDIYLSQGVNIYKMNSNDCMITSVCQLPYAPEDIAITSSGRFFACGNGEGIKEVDLITGDTTDIGNLNSGGTSLVALNDTLLLFDSNGYICSLNLITGDSASLGTMPVPPNGDWTLFKGELYVSTSNYISRITFDANYTTIASVNTVNSQGVSTNVFHAMVTSGFDRSCYEILAFSGQGVFTISPATGEQNHVCNFGGQALNNISGAAFIPLINNPCEEPTLNMPNVFTPNGDSRNDIFKVKEYSGVFNTNLSIYNRWGKLIHTSDISTGWDGEDVEAGVYYWVVECITSDQKAFSKQGYVSLLK